MEWCWMEAFCKALKSTSMQSKQWHFWFDLCSEKCDFVYASKAEQRAPCLSGGSFQPAWQFPSKKSQWSFTVFLLAERIRGRNVRPCLLDWGISLMTPTCLHDTLGRREYSNKLGPRWASCGKKDIKVAFRSKKIWSDVSLLLFKSLSFVCFGDRKLYPNQRLTQSE